MPRKKKSIVNVWTILALIVFYLAYNAYSSQGEIQTALVLAIIGVLLTYMGLSGGTKHEF